MVYIDILARGLKWVLHSGNVISLSFQINKKNILNISSTTYSALAYPQAGEKSIGWYKHKIVCSLQKCKNL